nr:hypothetical protein [Tanacetum cinerariifolium]
MPCGSALVGCDSIPFLTPEEQLVADTMQALKESNKPNRRQPGTGGSSEGTDIISGVPDESTFVSANLSEGTGTKPRVLDEEKVSTKEKKDDANDEKSINLEMTDDEETDDEVLQGKEYVNDDKDEDMSNADVKESGNGDEEDTDAAKADFEKIEEPKDDSKKDELPPTSSNLSISSSFGDQFLKLFFDTFLIGTIKDTTNVEINSLLDIKIQSEVPYIQSSFVLKVPLSVISKPSVLTQVQESPSVAPVTTLPPPSVSTIPPVPYQTTTPIPSPPITTDALTITTTVLETDAFFAVQVRVAKLEKDMSKLKKIDHSAKALAALKSQVPVVVEQYLGSKIDKASLKEYDQKSALYQTMHENKSFNINLANHRLYHALVEALIEDENATDKGVADTVKDHKRKHHHDDDDDDNKDPPTGLNQGFKTGKSASAKESVKEPIAEVVMDDAGEDVVRNDDQPQDTSEPKTAKTPNPDWFKQPLRPPTPDSKWNKHQVVLGQPEQPWFNQMVYAIKDPITFNDLMATPIDFSKYVLNRLKIDNHTQDLLLGPAYNLLKGTCFSSIELEYNFQECHLTIAVDYFFNNDLEYLKSSDLKRTYTTSIMKTKAARYEIVGIKDMVPTLWSTIKHAYDKYAAKGIKHWGERRKPCVNKLHGYGHLEEVMVKRADRQLYGFKEVDFVDLHLNDIEDMLILIVQHKLFHLNDSNIVDFIVALYMFTRSLVIKRRVEDLPLDVESYQKKLNIIAPQQTFLETEFKELYTPSYKPPGVIYEDLAKQKRVMRVDELYKSQTENSRTFRTSFIT